MKKLLATRLRQLLLCAGFALLLVTQTTPAALRGVWPGRARYDGESKALTVRNAHAMVYDSARGKVVLFGGADAERVCGDTWEWDGRRWRQVSSGGPAPRTFPAMAYDSVRGVTLLFGGNRALFGKTDNAANFLNDLWQWDGKQWKELRAVSPAPRAEAALAFDSRRARAILFGGYHQVNGERRRLGDTWEWDGARWTQASATGPSARNGVAMVYDRGRDRVALFGGNLMNGGGTETWEWDGHAWRRIEVMTEGRFNPALTYDEARRRVVRFGGWNGKERTGDTWEYDGKTWRPLAVAGPAARNHAALVYDRRRKRAILFGGHEGNLVFGDLWEWDGARWRQRIFTKPQARLDNGH
ncbi:MAG: kelch repeat-containing protein [Blastocatellales bacterium]